MTNLKKLFGAIFMSMETSYPDEIFDACELIIRVQEMDSGERDTIRAAYYDGPLFGEDVPSIAALDRLLEDGFIAKGIVKGEMGWISCTYKGASARALIEAMSEECQVKK